MALFPTPGQSTSLVSQLQPSVNPPTQNDAVILPASVSTARMTHVINNDASVLSAAFVDGTPIRGTYYRRLSNASHNRSTPVGSDKHDTSVYSSYVMIRNMEMRSVGAFTNDYNEERGTFSYTTEAVAYPGVIPLIGDIFLMPMEDTTAVFKVTKTVPMTWRNNAMTKVSMSWTDIYTPELHQYLNDSVASTLDFDLKTMLEYRTYLTEESVTQISQLRAMKKSMSIFMRRRYYSSTVNTYLRSDGVYDPLSVRYMQMTQDTALYERSTPNQINPLFTTVQFEESIYGAMLNTCDFSLVVGTCRRQFFLPSTRSSILTALVNREYVELGSDERYDQSYIFPVEFYNGVAQTPLETLVLEYIASNKSPDPTIILDIANQLPTLTDPNLQFYSAPLLIHLATLSEISLRRIGAPQL